MWSPPDKNALPSPEDLIYAKGAIITLDNALKDPFELLESTKLRIAKMSKDLEELKAWIAPIRKVPTEILADILLRASEMEDLAPVKFTAVSRSWQNIILATPKAWSFIHLERHYDIHVYRRNNGRYHDYFPGYKNTYFQRSKPRLSHLWFPEMEGFSQYSNSIIKEQAHRILCLTTCTTVLTATQSALECQRFPYLQTLNFVDDIHREAIDPSFFTISRFPALRTLRLPHFSSFPSPSPTISPNFFPPLQYLSLSLGLSSSMNLLQSCAATLTALDISYEGPNFTLVQIDFPLLRYLRVQLSSPSEPLVKASTPALTSLEVAVCDWSIPTFFDADVQKVTHLRWYAIQKPLFCTQVRVLQIWVSSDAVCGTGGYADYANELEEIANAYPSLERIELCDQSYDYLGTGVAQHRVEECLRKEFVKPELLWARNWQDVLPGDMENLCGLDMPCYE